MQNTGVGVGWGLGGGGVSSDEIMTCEKFNLGYFCACVLPASRSSVTSASPSSLPHPHHSHHQCPLLPLPHRPRLHTSVQQIQRAGTLLVKHLLKAGWKSQQRLQQPVSISGLPRCSPPAQLQRQIVQPHTFFKKNKKKGRANLACIKHLCAYEC